MTTERPTPKIRKGFVYLDDDAEPVGRVWKGETPWTDLAPDLVWTTALMDHTVVRYGVTRRDCVDRLVVRATNTPADDIAEAEAMLLQGVRSRATGEISEREYRAMTDGIAKRIARATADPEGSTYRDGTRPFKGKPSSDP